MFREIDGQLDAEHTDEDIADTYPELIDGPDTYPDWSQPRDWVARSRRPAR